MGGKDVVITGSRVGMNRFQKLVRAALATVIIFMFGAAVAVEIEFKVNPNKLPPCPKPDMSKKFDVGVGGRTEKWNNCWGKHTIGIGQDFKRDLKGLSACPGPNDFYSDVARSGRRPKNALCKNANHKIGLSNKNDVLEGEWRNGRLNGLGREIYSDGDIYVGAFNEGRRHGFGMYYFLEKNQFVGDRYVGDYLDGMYHGQGTYIKLDGREIRGTWKYDNFDIGVAKVQETTGIFFEGEYLNGMKHGFGIKTFFNGHRFEGEFEYGEVNGHGLDIYPDGDKFEAVYKNGERSGSCKYYGVNGNFTSANNIKFDGSCKGKSWHGLGELQYANGDKYVGYFENSEAHGKGIFTSANGNKYDGEWKRGKEDGYGEEYLLNGDKFFGNFTNGEKNGFGTYIWKNGDKKEGFYKNGIGVGLHTYTFVDGTVLKDLSENSHNLRANKIKKSNKPTANSNGINLTIYNSVPTSDGNFSIVIETNADTASLKINGEEQGGRADGKYSIKKIARAGGDTQFTIMATDINGNTDTKTITVSRPVAESKTLVVALNPAQVKRQPERDAVAIIIGIADYKNLPRADYANDDARVFYDYAIRALGVKPENIKLLVDADADEVGIFRAFKTWLPSRVSSKTDVYVFYSGHGLPSADGQGLYVLPQRADRDFIDKTAITQAEINSAIQAAKPKSVTIFLDACYSGQARTGETLLASARPISLKTTTSVFPDTFTVITASAADQISSSSPELKHGIFSYYLMRGMEGDADANKDGRITAGEMQAYLAENVSRQAGMMNRKQEPQLIGDAGRVLVGR